MTPCAEALTPDRNTIHCRGDRARLAAFIGDDVAVGRAYAVEGGPDAIVDGVADEAAVFEHCRASRGVDLARKLIEGSLRCCIRRQHDNGIEQRVATAEAFDTAAGGDLVRRQAGCGK